MRTPFGLSGGSQVICRVEEFTIVMLRLLTTLGTVRRGVDNGNVQMMSTQILL